MTCVARPVGRVPANPHRPRSPHRRARRPPGPVPLRRQDVGSPALGGRRSSPRPPPLGLGGARRARIGYDPAVGAAMRQPSRTRRADRSAHRTAAQRYSATPSARAAAMTASATIRASPGRERIRHDPVGGRPAGNRGADRAGGGHLHALGDPPGAAVQRAEEDPGEGQHVVDLVREVAAAGGHHGRAVRDRLGRVDLRGGVGQREDDRLRTHLLHQRRIDAAAGHPDEDVGAHHGVGQPAGDATGVARGRPSRPSPGASRRGRRTARPWSRR